MAVICYVSPHFPTPKPLLIKKQHANMVVKALHHRISDQETAPIHIRPLPRNKIFEDQSRGIVCYRDENGEITCEGYDEGPRLHKTLPTISYHWRNDEIVDLLKRSWLQHVNKET